MADFTTIELQHPLGLNGLARLMAYLEDKIGGNISHSVECNKAISNNGRIFALTPASDVQATFRKGSYSMPFICRRLANPSRLVSIVFERPDQGLYELFGKYIHEFYNPPKEKPKS